MEKYEKLKNILHESKSIVFFTGAGISTASNIPDFRSANGLYNEKGGLYRPEEIISHSFFMEHPEEFYQFYFDKMVYRNAEPNLAHKYIAELEKINTGVWVVTQNIDNLHQAAGSKHVIELHGSVHRNYCMNCGQFYDLNGILKVGGDVPKCPRCGGIIKPDVVLYEEQLDEDNIRMAIKLISEAETMVVIGTSLVVYPAASFVRYFRGKNLIIINKEATTYDEYCSLVLHDDNFLVIKEKLDDNLLLVFTEVESEHLAVSDVLCVHPMESLFIEDSVEVNGAYVENTGVFARGNPVGYRQDARNHFKVNAFDCADTVNGRPEMTLKHCDNRTNMIADGLLVFAVWDVIAVA